MQTRYITLAAATISTREEKYNGKKYLVVPVVALVEGVVQAMNAKAPEFVAAEEFSKFPASWNNRPVFVDHPVVKGQPVSGNTPDILAQSIGLVFNSSLKKGKLTMEAWIDIERATELEPELLDRIASGDPIEISVGLFCETDDSTGIFNGKKYEGAWHDLVPDHLALLSAGSKGACSREMGCGVRAAKGADVKKIDKTFGAMFAKMMSVFRSAQPAGEMSSGDLQRKLSEALRDLEPTFNYVEAFIPVTAPNRVVYSCYQQEAVGGYGYGLYERQFDLSDSGAVTINAARVEVEPVVTYEPVLMTDEPVVAAVEGEEVKDAVGKRNSAKDQAKIQAMHDHALALGAYCTPKVAEEGKPPCGCHDTKALQETDTMEKTAIAKFLETATPDQLKALGETIEGSNPAVKSAQDAQATAEAAAAKAKTDAAATVKAAEDKAAADVKAAQENPEFVAFKAAAEAKRTVTIKALKDTGRCKISDEVLAAKTQAELDQLVELAGTPKAATDFSGQGGPKDTTGGDKTKVAAAPDMVGAIKASREVKK